MQLPKASAGWKRDSTYLLWICTCWWEGRWGRSPHLQKSSQLSPTTTGICAKEPWLICRHYRRSKRKKNHIRTKADKNFTTRKHLSCCFSVYNTLGRKEDHPPLPLFACWLSLMVILVFTLAFWESNKHPENLKGLFSCVEVQWSQKRDGFCVAQRIFARIWHELRGI